ncbi:unnamed protein product [Cuscuta campestris]|uniref:Uncharacterized protein n=1 Tax=Cuscuta campestris TaxID=132261 RepID=A0A484NEU1_9ASTE|nr:unnamed protein product [Cuscuta campestris]
MAIQISKFEKLEELLRPHQHSLAPRRWKPRHKSSKPQLHLLLQNSIKELQLIEPGLSSLLGSLVQLKSLLEQIEGVILLKLKRKEEKESVRISALH